MVTFRNRSKKEDFSESLRGFKCLVLEPIATLKSRTKNEDDQKSVFARETLLEQLDGDEDLLQNLIALFNQDTPIILDSIRDAIAHRDSVGLERAAHKLLSSLGAVGAEAARVLALRLEEQGRLGNFEELEERFANLEREIDKVYDALGEFSAVCV